MSVLNRPFTKLSNSENTETGFIISFKKFPDIEEEFYKNLKGIVTKLTSSKKTKMLSYLIDHKVLSLGYSLTNIIHSTQPVYGINYSDSNTLKNIVIDVSKEELENPAAGLYDRVIAKCKEVSPAMNNKTLEYKDNWFDDYHMECVK